MHTILIVRMPAGRPAHPRSTPITEPRTAACSKLRHSWSSSAKVIAATLPPRRRWKDWVRCGDLPITLRRGESVLEKLKRGGWLLATPAASTMASSMMTGGYLGGPSAGRRPLNLSSLRGERRTALRNQANDLNFSLFPPYTGPRGLISRRPTVENSSMRPRVPKKAESKLESSLMVTRPLPASKPRWRRSAVVNALK